MKKILSRVAVLFAIVLIMLPANYVSASVDDTSLTTEEGMTVGGFRYNLKSDGTVEITRYVGSNMDVVIPDTIDGKKVSSIGNTAFYVSDITRLSLPGSVTLIDEGAFKYCEELETVIFREEGLLTIGDRGFDGCEKLSNITLPNTLTSIGECAFINTMKLTKINIPASITNLGRCIFYNSDITDVSLSEGLTFIGKEMFHACENLTKITIPSTVTEIQSEAFLHCSNLTNIVVPKEVKKIGEKAFYDTGIKKIKCYQGTAAYDYAKDNHIAIELLGPHFEKQEVTLYIGEEKALKVKKQKGTTNWKSSNTKVLKVSKDGVIHAVNKGNATITAMDDGMEMSCKVTVKDLSITEKSVTITTGKTTKLKIEGTKKTPVWSTSNSKVAAVSNKGVVTGKANGSTTITAKVAGKSYTCKVTVKNNEATFADDTSYYSYDEVGLCITKVYYNGKSMVAEGYVINNTSWKVTKIQHMNLRVYHGSSIAAEQNYSNYSLNLSAHTKKKVKFVIASSKVKEKSLDLRNSNISTDFDGLYEYYHY